MAPRDLFRAPRRPTQSSGPRSTPSFRIRRSRSPHHRTARAKCDREIPATFRSHAEVARERKSVLDRSRDNVRPALDAHRKSAHARRCAARRATARGARRCSRRSRPRDRTRSALCRPPRPRRRARRSRAARTIQRRSTCTRPARPTCSSTRSAPPLSSQLADVRSPTIDTPSSGEIESADACAFDHPAIDARYPVAPRRISSPRSALSRAPDPWCSRALVRAEHRHRYAFVRTRGRLKVAPT